MEKQETHLRLVLCLVHSLITVSRSVCNPLFLSTLLDALLTSVQRPLALCLFGHVFSSLCIWKQRSASVDMRLERGATVPAACLALNATSSSSMSFLSFLGAFRGLTLPPGSRFRIVVFRHDRDRTFSTLTAHDDGRIGEMRERAEMDIQFVSCLRMKWKES